MRKPARNWTRAEVSASDGRYSVLLDGREHRTPGGRAIGFPTRMLADAVAGELNRVRGEFDWNALPFALRSARAADLLPGPRAEMAERLSGYADSDLLCYRASEPPELAERQAKAWDPMLEWAAREFGAPLSRGIGVVPVPQPRESVERLRSAVSAMGPFTLTALNEMATLAGSLVLGLCALGKAAPAGDLWRMSRIDEDWQRERWGSDEEAERAADGNERAFRSAYDFAEACNSAAEPSI